MEENINIKLFLSMIILLLVLSKVFSKSQNNLEKFSTQSEAEKKYINSLINDPNNNKYHTKKCVNINDSFTGAKYFKASEERKEECKKIELKVYGKTRYDERIECLNKNGGTWTDQNKKDMNYLCSDQLSDCSRKDGENCTDDVYNTHYGTKITGCCKTEFDKEETFKKIFKNKILVCKDDDECIDNLCKNLNEEKTCLEASDIKESIFDNPDPKCKYISNTCRGSNIAKKIVDSCGEDCFEDYCNNHSSKIKCNEDVNCVSTYGESYANGKYLDQFAHHQD